MQQLLTAHSSSDSCVKSMAHVSIDFCLTLPPIIMVQWKIAPKWRQDKQTHLPGSHFPRNQQKISVFFVWLALPVGNFRVPQPLTAWYIGDDHEPSFPTSRASYPSCWAYYINPRYTGVTLPLNFPGLLCCRFSYQNQAVEPSRIQI